MNKLYFTRVVEKTRGLFTERQTDRDRDKETETGRQIQRQTDRQRDREREQRSIGIASTKRNVL